MHKLEAAMSILTLLDALLVFTAKKLYCNCLLILKVT